MIKRFCRLASVLMIIGVFSANYSRGEDGPVFKLEPIETLFIKNNLNLLAAKYNVDIQKAAADQARLWSNPNIAVEQNIFNQYTKRWFDFTSSGNTEIAVSQLILLAGKREKQLKYIDQTAQTASAQMYELTRNLKYELRKAYFDIVFAEKSLEFCNKSIDMVKETVEKTSKSFEKGAVLMTELLRLKSLLVSLQTERNDYITAVETAKSTLALITGDSIIATKNFTVGSECHKPDADNLESKTLADLLKTAIEMRTDLAASKSAEKADELNLDYQKSLATPDITVGGRWSRAGSYIPDYFGVTASIDIPVFNRNQGNIETATLNLQADRLNSDIVKMKIQSETSSAFAKALAALKTIKSIDPEFGNEYESHVKNMFDSYEKHNITIIELTDFYESFRNSVMQKNKLLQAYNDAVEELNYSVGTEILPAK